MTDEQARQMGEHLTSAVNESSKAFRVLFDTVNRIQSIDFSALAHAASLFSPELAQRLAHHVRRLSRMTLRRIVHHQRIRKGGHLRHVTRRSLFSE